MSIHVLHTQPKPTSIEKSLCDALTHQGIEVVPQAHDGYKHVDIKLPEGKMYVEIDGMQHLINPHQIVADLDRGHFSHKDGYDTMHIPNEMVRRHLGEITLGLAQAVKMREVRMKKRAIVVNIGS